MWTPVKGRGFETQPNNEVFFSTGRVAGDLVIYLFYSFCRTLKLNEIITCVFNKYIIILALT